jgi:hypothetical protein
VKGPQYRIAIGKVNLVITRPDEFHSSVPRPKYSVLKSRGLTVLGINSFRIWEVGLYSYLVSTHHANYLRGMSMSDNIGSVFPFEDATDVQLTPKSYDRRGTVVPR